ncbi:MAG: metalloregulator ArsR/SmtB family transcription factor [Pseudomonadota bacterium]|nr:metalloregulator ArsR/SmtB family transcription factor [Pseudomonadota bacterium]
MSARYQTPALPLAELQTQAAEAAQWLRSLANERRLLILCNLLAGERTVGELAEPVGLGQSALSQHLARLRHEGLVQCRRDGQYVYYGLADERVARLIGLLHEMFCAGETIRPPGREEEPR